MLALLAAFAPHAAAPGASDEPAIPAPAGYVNDLAGMMPEAARAKLEAFLDQLQRKTGAEFAVLTVKTTAPLDPAEYKVKVFERWKPGRRGQDNGLLLLVAEQERRIWFETGYGLEGTLPDGLQARIIREEMRPRFRAGDFAGGITAAVLRAAARIAAEKGVTLEWDGAALRYDGGARAGRVPLVLWIAILVFLVAIVSLSLAAQAGGMFYPYAGRRGRRGGWFAGPGGWGGGFGGGLGGFGGGGASFGGFGGGASGGGGGGGSW
ncbi:MAG: TPM domain-containing protein [Candidatus Eisenbacteria bacterium]|nr:TPM domain-containing protein [Candidatus Eisenbacteria bacterium]